MRSRGGPNHRSRRHYALTVPAGLAADDSSTRSSTRAELFGIVAGSQPRHQTVEHQIQVASAAPRWARRRAVGRPASGGAAARWSPPTVPPTAPAQPRLKRRVVAQLAGDLQPRRQPVELLGRGQHVPHHLDQSLAGRHVGHPLGVLARQLEEQGVLVAEVVEDGAARQPDRLLEPPHGRLVVAVLREASPGAVEDLTAARRQMVVGDPGHASATTAACCAARTAGCRRCGSSPPRRGCRCARPRRTRPWSPSSWWPSPSPSSASCPR